MLANSNHNSDENLSESDINVSHSYTSGSVSSYGENKSVLVGENGDDTKCCHI